MRNHLLRFLKHSETSQPLSLGHVAVQAALEPCLGEWVLWGVGVKGETCSTPLAVVERLGGIPQFGGAHRV